MYVPAQSLALLRKNPHSCMFNLNNILPMSLKSEFSEYSFPEGAESLSFVQRCCSLNSFIHNNNQTKSNFLSCN
jgi:hypothetical protein